VSGHSLLPWSISPAAAWDIEAADGQSVGLAYGAHAGRNADAAFIVRACNAHHELVAALKDMRSRFAKCASATGSDDWAIVGACEKADAALAKAGAA
jgi:hypothetical protein